MSFTFGDDTEDDPVMLQFPLNTPYIFTTFATKIIYMKKLLVSFICVLILFSIYAQSEHYAKHKNKHSLHHFQSPYISNCEVRCRPIQCLSKDISCLR